jgi:uncharacterized protein (UPF0335 family)
MIDERKKKLHGYITEIESWMARKAEIQASISEIFAVAKANGFDVRAMRAAIKARAWDAKELDAFRNLCEEYEHALGDFVTTDLGKAALDRASRKPS